MANYKLIKEICKKKGLTLKQLADTIGISETGLQKLLKDESTKVKTLEDIARALHIPISEFFTSDPNNRIYFDDDDYSKINEMINLAGLQNYGEQILSSFSYYDTQGRFITKHGVISEVFARFELKKETEQKIKEKDRLLSILQDAIENINAKSKM